jgi:hypothetical protein
MQYGAKVQGIGMDQMQPLSTFDPKSVIKNTPIQGMPTAPIPKGPGIGGIASSIGGSLMDMIPMKDPMEGAAQKGLDPAEMKQVENTGGGFDTATKGLNAAADVAGMIPGWGTAISLGLKGIGKLTEKLGNDKKNVRIDEMVAANTERTNDAAKSVALAAAPHGGLIYRRPTIPEIVTGVQTFEKGGKLTWDHKFEINLPEATIEKKKKEVKIFKRGGKFDNADKTNVIVTGARHHEDNGLGDKGVPVIDGKGQKVFEVETGEMILTESATEKVEKMFSVYKELEEDEDKAHQILKKLGKFFKEEVEENLHNYEEHVV